MKPQKRLTTKNPNYPMKELLHIRHPRARVLQTGRCKVHLNPTQMRN